MHNCVGLQRFQLFEGTVEGSLDAGVVAGETVELLLEIVVGQEILIRGASAELDFDAADAVKVPGGGY